MTPVLPGPSEELRKKLLAEELKLRSKQPEHWAKTKYRKYARPTPAELETAEKKKARKRKRRPKKAARAKRKR